MVFMSVTAHGRTNRAIKARKGRRQEQMKGEIRSLLSLANAFGGGFSNTGRLFASMARRQMPTTNRRMRLAHRPGNR
jgi:hypothetical protein